MTVAKLQLFVHYGLSFRKEFALLSKTLFKHLRPERPTDTHELSIPVLFMTATCTLDMKEQLSILTGLNFDPQNRNVFWPKSDGMMNVNVMTKVIYSTRPLHSF